MLNNKQELSSLLLATSKVKTEIRFKLNDLRANYSHELLKYIKSLESDLSTIESVHAILETKISNCIETMLELKGIPFIEFSADWDIYTLTTYTRDLSENEVIEIANFLGCKYHSSDCDIGYLNTFHNDEEEV
jgi:hypothetical protein